MQVGKIQNDTFSKNVIDLCWILYNKPRMVATFFLQRTNAFILFLIVPSLQISCFRKTKEKQCAKYDLNERIAARLIWHLVIHSCVIFAYIISRRDGENNGFLAGVSLPPSSLLARPSRFPRAQNLLSLPFQTPATQATPIYAIFFYANTVPTFGERLMRNIKWMRSIFGAEFYGYTVVE